MAALSLLFNAMVWGLSWWPLRYLQDLGVHPIWSTMLFFSLGAVLIGVWRPALAWAACRQPALLGLAVVAGITNAAFNWGVATGDVVRVVLLFYLMPLWAALLARWLLHEPISHGAWARIALALSGAVLVLKPAGQPWPHFNSLADVLGLIGGMGFAMTNVLLRQQAAQPAASRAFAMFAGCVTLPGVLGLLLQAQGMVPFWPAMHWVWVGPVLALGVLFLLSNLALQYGAAHLPVRLTSVLMLTEVLFATGSSAWWGGSALTAPVLMGGGLIVLAALLATFDEA